MTEQALRELVAEIRQRHQALGSACDGYDCIGPAPCDARRLAEALEQCLAFRDDLQMKHDETCLAYQSQQQLALELEQSGQEVERLEGERLKWMGHCHTADVEGLKEHEARLAAESSLAQSVELEKVLREALLALVEQMGAIAPDLGWCTWVRDCIKAAREALTRASQAAEEKR